MKFKLLENTVDHGIKNLIVVQNIPVLVEEVGGEGAISHPEEIPSELVLFLATGSAGSSGLTTATGCTVEVAAAICRHICSKN